MSSSKSLVVGDAGSELLSPVLQPSHIPVGSDTRAATQQNQAITYTVKRMVQRDFWMKIPGQKSGGSSVLLVQIPHQVSGKPDV